MKILCKDVGSYSTCSLYDFSIGTFVWKVSQILIFLMPFLHSIGPKIAALGMLSKELYIGGCGICMTAQVFSLGNLLDWSMLSLKMLKIFVQCGISLVWVPMSATWPSAIYLCKIRNLVHFAEFKWSVGEGTWPGGWQSLDKVQTSTWLSAQNGHSSK